MKRKYINIMIYLVLLLIFSTGDGYAQASSENHTLKKDVFDMSGGSSVSTHYQVKEAVGQPSTIGCSEGETVHVSAGFLAAPVVVTRIEDRMLPEMPQSFMLYQNFPNPFNPETTIKFDVKKFCQVRLTVYDLLGRQLGVLIDRTCEPGGYQVSFDAFVIPSGVYLYRIQMGTYCAVKKMMLVR